MKEVSPSLPSDNPEACRPSCNKLKKQCPSVKTMRKMSNEGDTWFVCFGQDKSVCHTKSMNYL